MDPFFAILIILIGVVAVFFAVLLALQFGFRLFNLDVKDRYLAICSTIITIGIPLFFSSYNRIATESVSNILVLPSRPTTVLPSRPTTEREASRLFAGPSQYPPTDFAAYGIIAFRSRAAPDDRKRYLMFCETNVALLPHTSEVLLPRSRQMVTVWPIQSDNVASHLNRAPRREVCEPAIDNYGLVLATTALKDAGKTGADLNDQGPFLLAWSPSSQKGKDDALVLVANLSNVTTSEQAKLRLQRWKTDILLNPEIWERGWNLERVRITVREWADKFGPKILTLFGDQK